YELKPAYAAAHTFNRELSGFQFSKRINLGNLDHHGYLFQSPAALCVVVWTTGGVPAEVKVPSSPGFFTYHDHTGMRASGGAVTQSGEGLALRLTDAPVFVKFARRENPALEKATEALPVALAVLPCAGGQAAVQVTSLERRPVKGRIVLTDVEGLKVAVTSGDLNLAAGAVSTVVLFPLAEPPGASYRLGARLEIQGRTLLMVPARRFVPQPASFENGLRTFVTGDDKVPGNATLVKGAAPVPPPGGGGDATWLLKCDFGAGWKFSQVIGAEAARHRVPGLPESGQLKGVTRFGLWVHGDASRTVLRMRFQDAAGRTWQPDGPTINWTGWRFVEMKLDERTAHWGGKKEPGSRALPEAPLVWDTFLLLDNPTRVACQPSVYFQMPMLIEE
ncbi:MAG: hypothetical protein ACAI34_21470, partial [Verrucomicrobium sp.]